MPEERAKNRENQLRRHFPEAWVTGYENLIPVMTIDEKDRHVLAAAVRCGAEVIVTFNARHFPTVTLNSWNIQCQGPSTFLRNLYDLDPALVIRKLYQQAEAISVTFEHLLVRLSKNVPSFVSYVCEEQKIQFPAY